MNENLNITLMLLFGSKAAAVLAGAVAIGWVMLGLGFGVAYLLRYKLATIAYACAVVVMNVEIGISPTGTRRTRRYVRMERMARFYSLLSGEEGSINQASIARAQECSQDLSKNAFETWAVASLLSRWVEEEYTKLASVEARRILVDSLMKRIQRIHIKYPRNDD